MGGVTFCTWARLRFMAGSCITVRGERFIVRCNLIHALDSAVLYHGPGDLYPSLCACSTSVLCLCPSLKSPSTAPDAVFLGIDVCPHSRSLHFLGTVEGPYEACHVWCRGLFDRCQLLVV